MLDYKGMIRHILGRKGEAKTEDEVDFFLENIAERYKVATEENQPFHAIWIARNESEQMVGEINFKGGPNEFGVVEFADYVQPEFRNQGFATEMRGAMVKWAREDERVVFIIGNAYNDNVASIRAVEKCGFRKLERNETRTIFILQLKF